MPIFNPLLITGLVNAIIISFLLSLNSGLEDNKASVKYQLLFGITNQKNWLYQEIDWV